MCTYLTERTEVTGSAKGPTGWFGLSHATVYFDHPVHAAAEHTLNIDFSNVEAGPAARVAVELSADSARALVAAIEATLAAAPGLSGPTQSRAVTAAAASRVTPGRRADGPTR